MYRQQYLITDGAGRTMSIEVELPWSLFDAMRTDRTSDSFTNSGASWRSLSPGALGAENGPVLILAGGGNAHTASAFHLHLYFRSKRSKPCPIVILTGWLADGSPVASGPATISHGLNLSMRSGSAGWSMQGHHDATAAPLAPAEPGSFQSGQRQLQH